MSFLTEQVHTKRVMNAVAAGTSDQNSSSVDMASDGGWDGVRFIFLAGTLTSSQVTKLKAQVSSDDGGSDDFSDLASSASTAMADADSNKMIILDIQRPPKRYVRCVVDRGTANCVIDGVIAEMYRGRNLPSTIDSTTSSRTLLAAPAEGTA